MKEYKPASIPEVGIIISYTPKPISLIVALVGYVMFQSLHMTAPRIPTPNSMAV